MIEKIRQAGTYVIAGGKIDENTGWSLVETRWADTNEVKSRYIHVVEIWDGNTGTWLDVNNVPESADSAAVASRAAAYLEKHPVNIDYADIKEGEK